jgi:putative nucleotidyltransferase with HDIG domain
MISEKDSLNLLKKYNLVSGRIEHSIGVAKTAHEIAVRICSRHPNLPIDPEKVKIAALLHDIGRAMPGDHEINTLFILKSEGLEDIASITMHGSCYEIMQLRGIENPSLIPETIENKIVAYADAIYKDRPVTLKERWEEIEKRRADEPEKVASLHKAKKRFLAMEEEIRELMK